MEYRNLLFVPNLILVLKSKTPLTCQRNRVFSKLKWVFPKSIFFVGNVNISLEAATVFSVHLKNLNCFSKRCFYLTSTILQPVQSVRNNPAPGKMNKYKNDAETLHLVQRLNNELKIHCTELRCRNSARPYFSLNSLLCLQQTKDAEILHLRSVA